MQIIENYRHIAPEHQNAVLVIGNFDGVHRGHQALLDQARALADEHNTIVSVLTFEPHPRSLFRPDEPAFRITSPEIKARRLEEEGIDLLFSLPFGWDFASQSAETFVRDILVEGLKPAHVIVGYDFRFGQMRKGTPETIKGAGLPVTIIDEIGDEGGKYSSSTIRQHLRHGHIAQANALLGWDWFIEGTVRKGDRRGHAIGYPTANFPLGDSIHPAYGVYAAHVQIEGEEAWMRAAINIGIRPMFEIAEAQMEAYILDFDRDIYGKILRVRPVQFLRGEAKFDSVEALVAQMDEDCTQAREILKS